MSFNPYNKNSNGNQAALMMPRTLPSHNEDIIGNNDTKMSNNEAFLAFLQKNDSDDSENEEEQ